MNEKIYFARYVRRCPAEHWLRKHQTVDKGTGRSKQGAVSTSDFQEICSIGIGQLLILFQHWCGYTRPLALDAADSMGGTITWSIIFHTVDGRSAPNMVTNVPRRSCQRRSSASAFTL